MTNYSEVYLSFFFFMELLSIELRQISTIEVQSVKCML